MSWEPLLITGVFLSLMAAFCILLYLVLNWLEKRLCPYRDRLVTWWKFRQTKRVLDRHATSTGVRVALNGSIRRKP